MLRCFCRKCYVDGYINGAQQSLLHGLRHRFMGILPWLVWLISLQGGRNFLAGSFILLTSLGWTSGRHRSVSAVRHTGGLGLSSQKRRKVFGCGPSMSFFTRQIIPFLWILLTCFLHRASLGGWNWLGQGILPSPILVGGVVACSDVLRDCRTLGLRWRRLGWTGRNPSGFFVGRHVHSNLPGHTIGMRWVSDGAGPVFPGLPWSSSGRCNVLCARYASVCVWHSV